MDWSQVATVGLTGAFTLAAGLGGSALSDRRQERRADVERRHARREELREVLGTFLVDAQELVDLEWVMIPAYAKMSSSDLTEFIDTDSGKTMAARNARLRLSLTQARLLAGNTGQLSSALHEFRLLFVNLAEEAHGPVMGDSTSGATKMDGIGDGFKHIGKMQRSISRIEEAAMVLISSIEDPDPPTPFWRRIRQG